MNIIDTLAQDVKYALKQMTCNPEFACVAILALALDIGASTAIFSVVNTILIRPYVTNRAGSVASRSLTTT